MSFVTYEQYNTQPSLPWGILFLLVKRSHRPTAASILNTPRGARIPVPVHPRVARTSVAISTATRHPPRDVTPPI